MPARSLRSVSSVASERPVKLGEALGILRDAAEALGQLHATGRVHGAVCADNLVLDDHGVTRLCRDTPTPAALSPEQRAGDAPDVRSDVYGLGATIAELVADAETLPVPFERLLGQMTAEEPAARYESMDQVLMALEACELMTGCRACRPGTEAQATRERRGLLVVLVILLGVAMLALAMLAVFGPTREPRGKPPEAHGELTDLVEKLAPLPDSPKPTTNR